MSPDATYHFAKCTVTHRFSNCIVEDDKEDDDSMSLPLHHPFTALLAGPTGCGKTRFIFKLVDNISRMIDPPPSRIVYCYGEYQQLFREYSDVVFRQGLPDVIDFDGSEPVLLIIDDLMNEVDESVANIFTRGSHHRNVGNEIGRAHV